MLTKILRKRTRVELEAWQAVRDLMPRNRKTKGNQFEALEFLFEHLYEHVSEADLADYLLKVKGHLQRTGDPVKGAINQAVKELQRLPNRPFEIIKIQQAGLSGLRRFVQLNYTSFEEVIGFDLYLDYLLDVLRNEREIIVRGISRTQSEDPTILFPGLAMADLTSFRTEFLLSHNTAIESNDHLKIGYIPDSTAIMQFVAVYEDKDKPIPFLAFIANANQTAPDTTFILYRGANQKSKLEFLHNLWQETSIKALSEKELETLRIQATTIARELDSNGDMWQNRILHGLVAEHCKDKIMSPISTE